MKDKEEREVHRGSIYTCNYLEGVDSVQRGRRPVIVVQNDTGNTYSNNTIVVPLTSNIKKFRYPTQLIVKADDRYNQLRNDSLADTGQLRVVSKSTLTRYLGRLSDEELEELDKAMKVSIDLSSEDKYVQVSNIFDIDEDRPFSIYQVMTRSIELSTDSYTTYTEISDLRGDKYGSKYVVHGGILKSTDKVMDNDTLANLVIELCTSSYCIKYLKPKKVDIESTSTPVHTSSIVATATPKVDRFRYGSIIETNIKLVDNNEVATHALIVSNSTINSRSNHIVVVPLIDKFQFDYQQVSKNTLQLYAQVFDDVSGLVSKKFVALLDYIQVISTDPYARALNVVGFISANYVDQLSRSLSRVFGGAVFRQYDEKRGDEDAARTNL